MKDLILLVADKSMQFTPELDVWMWGSDNALTKILRWPLSVSIREWLVEHNFTF